MNSGTLTDAQRLTYEADGSILVRNLFKQHEVDALRQQAKNDHQMDQHSYGRGDGEGGEIRLSLWNQPGNGIYGAFAR